MTVLNILILLALIVVPTQSSHAFFPYASYFGGYPAFGYSGLIEPYVGTVVAPIPIAAPYSLYSFPYALHSHYYHPRSAFRNIAKSFHKEDGHLSDTSFISPVRKNKLNL